MVAGQGVEHVVVVVEVVRGQCLADGGDGQLDLASAQVGDRRHSLDGDLLLGELLDVEQQPLFARLGEGDGHTLASGPADSTDAVDVALGSGWHVVVDDVSQRVDVEAAGGDIGGHQQLGSAVTKAAHHPVALWLIHAAVQRLGAIAATVHRLGQLVDLGACAAEDESGLRCFDVEDAAERSRLVRALHHVGALANECRARLSCRRDRSGCVPGRAGTCVRGR